MYLVVLYAQVYGEVMSRVQSGTVAVRVMGNPDGGGGRFLEQLAGSFPRSRPQSPSELQWSTPVVGSVWSVMLDVNLVAQSMSQPSGSEGTIVCVQGQKRDVDVLLEVLDLWFRRVSQDPPDLDDPYAEICMELVSLD